MNLDLGYKELYSFKGAPDGGGPVGSLLAVNGALYGTTSGGGTGAGTVFKVSPNGAEQVLHDFGKPDGVNPEAGLVLFDGSLYGTTLSGGTSSNGTVFKITTSGKEQVIHNFGGTDSGDGKWPNANLLVARGNLFGTTEYGGKYGLGSVFKVTPSGDETVLYSFRGSPHDGAFPWSGVVVVDGTFYGTTEYGGANHGYCLGGSEYGCGTVFKLTASGVETVIHSFVESKGDGIFPRGTLLWGKGLLYGTTYSGDLSGRGTVYSITTSGKENTLFDFGAATIYEGGPIAGVTELDGTLYGTTSYGAGSGCRSSEGRCGTIFSISPSGKEQMLYAFQGSPDGETPWAGLTFLNRNLYG